MLEWSENRVVIYRKLAHIPLVSAIPLGMGFHKSQLYPSSLGYSPRLRQNLYPSGGVCIMTIQGKQWPSAIRAIRAK